LSVPTNITGRYCSAINFRTTTARKAPHIASRVTGAPFITFAAFRAGERLP